MAEKSSQLEEIKAIDTDSTENLVIPGETTLETRETDYSLNDDSVSDEASDDDTSIEAEHLREQIVETRRGMSETIDAIQEKLSFANISEQVKDQVSEQIGSVVETAKDAFLDRTADVVNSVGRSFRQIGKSEFGKKVQENPTALALIGAGIGALMVSVLVSGNKKDRNDYSYDYEYEYDDDDSYDSYDSDDEVRYADFSRHELNEANESYYDESTSGSYRERMSDTSGDVYSTVADATDSAYKGISNAASSTYETAGSVASKTYSGVSNIAGKTYESVGNVASKTYEVVGSAADYTYHKAGDLGGHMKVNYNHYIEENPLAVGAVALAVGAAIGFAIPLTSRENELMGEYRDNVVEKAQATAQEAIGTVKQMASDAQKVIAEEVKSKTA